MESSVEPYSFLLALFQPVTFGVAVSLVVMILLLVGSAIVSGSEVAFFSLSPTDLDELEKSKGKRSKRVLHLLEKPKRLLATILIANNFINVGIVILSTYIIDNLFNFSGLSTGMVLFLQVGVVTFIILLLGEVVPKVYATKKGRGLAIFMAFPLTVMEALFSPVSRLLVAGTSVIDKRIKKKGGTISVSQLSHALELTDDENGHAEEQKILEGIVKFGNTDAKQIMKPRLDMVAFDEAMSYEEILPLIVESGFSRIPIYKDNIDQITGVLYTKDLLPHLKEKEMDWAALIRPTLFVPENKKIDDLLKEFQEKKVHLAVVVDEYGGTSGLVTLEDILEEIVGDITDEFDSEDLIYSKLDDLNYVFEGKTPLNDLYRVLDIDGNEFEEQKGESDTLAGFVIEQAGKIPLKNEKVMFGAYTFTVEAADRRRVKQIKITINEVQEPTQKNGKGKSAVTIALLLVTLLGCEEPAYIPKPMGYYRIDFPEKEYAVYDDNCPYQFERPAYSTILDNATDSMTYCFKTIAFPQYKATISITYKSLTDSPVPLSEYSQHSRDKAYEHDIKAIALNESGYYNDTTRVYARMFDIDGNVAKNTVFYCTDSTNHFMHGELMFWATPNYDSLQPVIAFIRQDIEHFIKTLRWEEN